MFIQQMYICLSSTCIYEKRLWHGNQKYLVLHIYSSTTMFPFILNEIAVPFHETLVRTTTLSTTTACTYPIHRTKTLSTTRACTYPIHVQGSAWPKEESTTCSTDKQQKTGQYMVVSSCLAIMVVHGLSYPYLLPPTH
jgi:hypothetical protein